MAACREMSLESRVPMEQGTLDALPVGVIVLDTRGRVSLANAAANALLGEMLLGRPWAEVIGRCFILCMDDRHGVPLANGKRVQVSTASLPDHSGQLLLLTELPQCETAVRPPASALMFEEPVAVADSSREILALARRVAASEVTVLITGESGTGKEVLARYIHAYSARTQQPFVAINCAAIPENMLESTLFGYEKGAFTGAVAAMPGKFEQANGGTLLLDEISEMPPALQAKLLRVLQEREVERLGSRRMVSLDVRVLATSNRDLREAVRSGQFREDLYFRLSVLPLAWLPLRERRADILPLAQRLLMHHARRQQREAVMLSAGAESALLHYRFPGNVRELDNIVQRALIMQAGSVIEPEDLCLDMTALQHMSPARTMPDQSDASGLVEGVRHHEYQIIIDTLSRTRGSRKSAAEKLGISPRTLRYKLAQMREVGMMLDA